ncbi:monovalent cation/H(+) antiporter subunit G [Corynebacterium kroppenstedtii]|uniref:monovalent cation/H(+) antiporter subunit G n=1 Tax=Corynebacterium sp. PCR 32 TaxID=3351342 RepID=UPI0030A4208E
MMVNIIIAVLVVLAAVAFIDEVIEMWRAPDALTRVNLTGPITGVGIPLLIIANLVRSIADGDVWYVVAVKSVIAIFACLMVSSVGSYVMGRSIHAEQIRRGQSATMGKGAGYTGKAETTAGTSVDGQPVGRDSAGRVDEG